MSKNPRIAYISGPVDAVDVYNRFRSGKRPEYLGVSYIMEFIECLSEIGIPGFIITSHNGNKSDTDDGSMRIVNIPKLGGVGILYHLRQVKWLFSVLWMLFKAKSKHVVLTDCQDYWFITLLFRPLGFKFINALHCAIWPPFASLAHKRIPLRILNGSMHYLFGDYTLAASNIIKHQVGISSLGRSRCEVFLPVYREGDIEVPLVSKPRDLSTSLKVMFAGRIIRSKGVFDLIDSAEILRDSGITVQVNICGDGPDIAELRAVCRERNMSSVHIHGFCGRDEMVRLLHSSDCVVIPTRAEFEEGFAMIAAEAVLACKPVITSQVVPALQHIREAAIEVAQNNVVEYAEAILRLAQDKYFLNQKISGANNIRSIFLESRNRYATKLKCAIIESNMISIAKPA